MIPATYRAEAVILVDGQKVPERYVASTVNADVQDRLATISQQILATSRLQRIIDSYHLYQREKPRPAAGRDHRDDAERHQDHTGARLGPGAHQRLPHRLPGARIRPP